MIIVSLLVSAILTCPQAISLDLRDADLREVLMMLGTTASPNVVLHPAVQGKVSLTVHDARPDVLLDIVLNNYSLGREVQGNITRIAPLSVLADEYRQRAATEEARLTAVPLETRIYVLNYAKAADVALITSKLLSPRGVVIVDPRRNAIIVRDVVP